MGCRTHDFFFCQYYFSFASPHFLNVSRMGSHHIQHLGLGGDSLVKLCRLGRPKTAAFALMGFPTTTANIVFLLTTGNYWYIYILVILFDWHSRMSCCHIVIPVITWVVCLLLLLLKIKDSWFLFMVGLKLTHVSETRQEVYMLTMKYWNMNLWIYMNKMYEFLLRPHPHLANA